MITMDIQGKGSKQNFIHCFCNFPKNVLDCEQSLFCSKILRENERDGMRDIRAASGEAASRE